MFLRRLLRFLFGTSEQGDVSTNEVHQQIHGLESNSTDQLLTEDQDVAEEQCEEKKTSQSQSHDLDLVLVSTPQRTTKKVAGRVPLPKKRSGRNKRTSLHHPVERMAYISRAAKTFRRSLRQQIGIEANLESSLAAINVREDEDETMNEGENEVLYQCGACLDEFKDYNKIPKGKGKGKEKSQASSSAMTLDDHIDPRVAMEGFGIVFPCQNRLCCDCLRNYLQSRISDAGNGVRLEPLSCAECKKKAVKPTCITAANIKLVLSVEEYEKYEQTLVLDRMTETVYCPNTSCVAVFDANDIIRDNQDRMEPKEKVICPQCSTVACTKCKIQWHEGFTCETFKNRPMFLRSAEDSDVLVIELAKKEGLKRCPRPACGHLIQLADGCNHITCICGHQFCYLCLSNWLTTTVNGNRVEKCSRGDRGGKACPLYTENTLRGIIQREGPQMRRHDMKWIKEERNNVPYQKSNTFTRHMLASRKCGYCEFKSKKWPGLINHLESTPHDVFDCCAKFYKTRADFDSHVRNTHPRRQWVEASQVLHRRVV